MIHSFPKYYKEFSCIANQCEATCCAGWQIVVDEESLEKYKKVTGEFAGRIKAGVDFTEGVFFQDNEKRCAFLNENNLCDMYTALGEEAFCETCRRYPRHIEEFENVREFTLSASCPEAARILLAQKEPVQFYEVEVNSLEEEFEDFDLVMYEKLVEARGEMLKVLQNREIPIKMRAAALWDFIQIFQEKMDEGSLFTEETIYESLMPRNPGTTYEEAKALFALLYHLEVLADDWEKTLRETEQTLYGTGATEYNTIKEEFATWKTEHFPDWDVMCEQLLVYFIYTYFCGAVYDEYVASKVKMSVCSVFYMEELATAQWVKNGGSFTIQEFIRIVYRYSRELEHSDENLITMDKIMEEI
ncbi:MAG: flagellin lysine-N-methylase [Lachnospiraceae bacterium]|nr:flagellin lysine-N-methylase [Lachnospiraceae bacterium]